MLLLNAAGGEPATLGGYTSSSSRCFSVFSFTRKPLFRDHCTAAVSYLCLLLSSDTFKSFLSCLYTYGTYHIAYDKKGENQIGLILIIGAVLFPVFSPQMTMETKDRVQYTLRANTMPVIHPCPWRYKDLRSISA